MLINILIIFCILVYVAIVIMIVEREVANSPLDGLLIKFILFLYYLIALPFILIKKLFKKKEDK